MASEPVTLADGEALQGLIPGVAPVTPAARAMTALERRRWFIRHCNAPMPEGGLFDEEARKQASLL